jgi:uncharacterized lipoprotein YbaY
MLVGNFPKEHVRGQIFISGSEPLADATLTVQLVDASLQDAPCRVLASETIALSSRPTNNWQKFSLTFGFPGPGHADLQQLAYQARIEVDGRLKYITKVSHKANINQWQVAEPTIVVEPV